MASFRPNFDWQRAGPASFSSSTKARHALQFDISFLDGQRKAVLGNTDSQSVAQAGCLTNMIAALEDGCSKVMLRFTEQQVQQECDAACATARRIYDAFLASQPPPTLPPPPPQQQLPPPPPSQQLVAPPQQQQQQQQQHAPGDLEMQNALVTTREPTINTNQACDALEYISGAFHEAVRQTFQQRAAQLGNALRMDLHIAAEVQAQVALNAGERSSELIGQCLVAFGESQQRANQSLLDTNDDGLFSLVRAFLTDSRALLDQLVTQLDLVQIDMATRATVLAWRARFERAVGQPQLLLTADEDGHRVFDEVD